MKGKGTKTIMSYKVTKIITDVLFVLDIDQNLECWSIVGKGYKVLFENKPCSKTQIREICLKSK